MTLKVSQGHWNWHDLLVVCNNNTATAPRPIPQRVGGWYGMIYPQTVTRLRVNVK